MEETQLLAEFNVKLKVLLVKDAKGEYFCKVEKDCPEEFSALEQASYLTRCIEDIESIIENRISHMIKVPAKYYVILEGLIEEREVYNKLLQSFYNNTGK